MCSCELSAKRGTEICLFQECCLSECNKLMVLNNCVMLCYAFACMKMIAETKCVVICCTMLLAAARDSSLSRFFDC